MAEFGRAAHQIKNITVPGKALKLPYIPTGVKDVMPVA